MKASEIKEIREYDEIPKRDLFKCEVDSTIMIFAFRYALGRMSYAPGMVVETLIKNEDHIPKANKELIIHEILDHESTFGNLGHEYDRRTWYDLIDRWMEND